jgi:hypothetical protein
MLDLAGRWASSASKVKHGLRSCPQVCEAAARGSCKGLETTAAATTSLQKSLPTCALLVVWHMVMPLLSS